MLYACLAALGMFGLLALTGGGSALADDQGKGKTIVILDTSEGPITLELEPTRAPKTVENFLKYADDGFYNDTVFHRVIPGFMIQGGGHAKDTYREKETRGPVKNESNNGLSNTRGTIAMARKADPDSATAQFYINLADKNSFLDQSGGGYTVFGRVIDGMSVVDRIAAEPTGTQTLEMIVSPGQTRKVPADDVPTKPITIKSVKRKGA